MRYLAVMITTLAVFTVAPASAQDSKGLGQTIGDVLSGVLGKDAGGVQGHVVLATGPELIFRGSDGRTYRVDTSSLPAAEWRSLKPGDAITLAAKRGAAADQLVAERIQRDASGRQALYQTTRGTVQSVTGSEATLRTDDGRTMTLDISSLPAAARPTANQPATIVYEGSRGSARATALWLEPDSSASATQPSASVPTGAASGTQSGYQRIHGYIESIGVSTLTLKTDSGQTLPVDISGLSPQQLASTRPGDVVSVVGQMTGTSFKASVMQKD
jgi:hypothetical protein